MASFRLILIAVLSVVLLDAVVVAANTLHQHMSEDELRRVFHVDSHDQVPEYEIVHVHSAPRRSEYTQQQQQQQQQSPNLVVVSIATDITSAPHRTSDSSDNSDSDKTKPSATNQVPPPSDKLLKAEADAIKHLRLSAFGKHMKLKLKKATGLFKGDSLKMWYAETNVTEPHQVQYTEQPEIEEDIGEIYQDEDNMAALLLQNEDGGALAVEGTIGHELVVKPVPSSLRRHLTPPTADDELFLDDEGEDIASDVSMDTGLPIQQSARTRTKRAAQSQQHIVYKRNMATAEDELENDYAFMEPDHLSKRHRSKRSITKREAPYVIYPEILVIVDYDGYRLHGGDNVQIKRYFVSFWNGVDLRYKLLKGPKIRISIAGIIISRGRDATPYLERNRVGRDAIDSAAALTDMGKYLFRERRLPVYDIAVAVTKYDMCRRRKGGRCTKGTAGFAYVGGACVVNKRLEKVNSVAIIEDTGGFSGIIVGAHEVGHLLGAVHDGSPPPSYLGGPGAEKCRWEDGFIMSDLRHTDKGFKWSPCSVTSFHHFLNGDTATCLYNSPHEDESLPRVLPGKLLTLDAQCRKDRGTSACFKDDRVCAQLFCFDAGSGYCVAYRPAAEGSTCGDGQYCINGRCTTEHENIIPDYSQNTPTYLRRNDADTSATQSRPVYTSLANVTTQRYSWNDYKSTQPITTTTTTTTTTTQTPSTQVTLSTPKYPFKHVVYNTSPKNPYLYKQTTKYPYAYTNKVSSTTVNPYEKTKNYNQYTTKSPFQYVNKVTTTGSPYYEKNKHLLTSKSPFQFVKMFTTTKSPYDFSNFFQKTTTLAPPKTHITTENPYYKYFKDLTSTTKKPITTTLKNQGNYNHYNQFYGSTTLNPYAVTPKPYNPYTTTTTTEEPPAVVVVNYYETSATKNTEYKVKINSTDTAVAVNAAATDCVDTATKIGGSMSCNDFLLRYGYQYCQYRYMKRNCCASHRTICETQLTS